MCHRAEATALTPSRLWLCRLAAQSPGRRGLVPRVVGREQNRGSGAETSGGDGTGLAEEPVAGGPGRVALTMLILISGL